MSIDYLIYEDSVIAVKLFAVDESNAERGLYELATRYLKPQNTKYKDGSVGKVTNAMGGETDWFILPASFAYAVGKTLIEQKVSGLDGFNEDGFRKMIDWLIDMEVIQDAMVY